MAGKNCCSKSGRVKAKRTMGGNSSGSDISSSKTGNCEFWLIILAIGNIQDLLIR
jgi:hypothetical protein